MKKTVILFLCILCSPGFCGVFSASGHKKANGLNIEVHYPDGWTAQEGIRPHIVQKFDNNNGSFCMLQIQSIGENLSQKEWNANFVNSTLDDWDEILRDLSQQTKMLSMKHTKYEGLDGVMLKVEQISERGGMTVNSMGVMHIVGYRDSFIMLQCMSGGLTKLEAIQRFNEVEKDFVQFGTGLVLLDKYL